ncbi:YtxH domain-containing protein, partial [Dysosmobacter welbionis]
APNSQRVWHPRDETLQDGPPGPPPGAPRRWSVSSRKRGRRRPAPLSPPGSGRRRSSGGHP